MTLALTSAERLARAQFDLRLGAVVAVTDGARRALVMAAEVVSAARLADLRALGNLDLAITRHRAETLRTPVYDGDLVRFAVPERADPDWIAAVADPAADLTHPLKGPFQSRREGKPDLHRAALALCKAAHLLPAALVVGLAEGVVLDADVTEVSLSDIADPTRVELVEVASAAVPLAVSNAGHVRVFRPSDGGAEHYAVEIGTLPRPGPVLARLHSACFTGDVLGSLKCDCGAQLAEALRQIGAEGAGVLLYLNQEGRGIGLANKLRAYGLQEQGFDTVEANHRLGFEDDERDFAIGAEMLRAMGVSSLRLMTNNPAKVARMRDFGIEVVERVALKTPPRAENADYLAVKARKSGHLL